MLSGSDDSIREPKDLREVPDADRPDPRFFGLHKKLKKRSGFPLRRGKRKHRFGYLTFVAKDKARRNVESKEIQKWDDLKWRSVVSSYRSQWKGWYSAIGRCFSLIKQEKHPLNFATGSPGDVQEKVEVFNRAA